MNSDAKRRNPIEITLSGHEGMTNGSELEAMAFEMQKALNIAARKNRAYGSAWREQGWMGNLARILSKTSRLKALLWRDDARVLSDDEAVIDTLHDLINLTVFALMNLGQQNRWGK